MSQLENINRQIRDVILSFEHGELTWAEFHIELEALLEVRREVS